MMAKKIIDSKNISAENVQAFIKRYKLTECFEAGGFLFRVRAHAESHNKIIKGDGVQVHGKESPSTPSTPSTSSGGSGDSGEKDNK